MPLHTPAGKQFSLHQLMAMSTMLTPSHHNAHAHFHTHAKPLIQAGGGEALSEIPVQNLYLSHDIQDHLQQVYTSLCGNDNGLSAEKLTAWLQGVQGIDQKEKLDKQSYKFGEFLALVFAMRGFEAVKEMVPEEKDLSKPISNYYISSSHNTYLEGNQLSSRSSSEAYKNVLLRGCRCIEIDVVDGEDYRTPEPPANGAHSPKPDHKRHISGGTISSFVADASEVAGRKIKDLRQKLENTGLGINLLPGDERGRSTEDLSQKGSHRRSPSVRSMLNGEPLVTHAWTAVTPCGFRDVCKAVRETAFVTTDLPIIVSLEVHANLAQQEVMVEIMKEEWSGLLIDQAHPECDPEERLPRLEELRNKILIKVKKGAPRPPAELSTLSTPSSNTLSPMPSRHDAESAGSASESEQATKKKPAKICDNLSNLGIYTHSEHFTTLDAKSATKPSHIFSISESHIMELHEKRSVDMFMHNRDYFMRAFPGGLRIYSSNYDPAAYWRRGVQMAALNWQSLDEAMMLNEGMFAGEQGWALKPPGYRSDRSELVPLKSVHLKITFFAGQHIPVPHGQTDKHLQPSIRCNLHVDHLEDRRNNEQEGVGKFIPGQYKYRTHSGKTDHPDFGPGGWTIDFRKLDGIVEELSFVRFKVEDTGLARDDLAAWACIRLDKLQQGYRFIPLLDGKGIQTAGMLLVRVEKDVS